MSHARVVAPQRVKDEAINSLVLSKIIEFIDLILFEPNNNYEKFRKWYTPNTEFSNSTTGNSVKLKEPSFRIEFNQLLKELIRVLEDCLLRVDDSEKLLKECVRGILDILNKGKVKASKINHINTLFNKAYNTYSQLSNTSLFVRYLYALLILSDLVDCHRNLPAGERAFEKVKATALRNLDVMRAIDIKTQEDIFFKNFFFVLSLKVAASFSNSSYDLVTQGKQLLIDKGLLYSSMSYLMQLSLARLYFDLKKNNALFLESAGLKGTANWREDSTDFSKEYNHAKYEFAVISLRNNVERSRELLMEILASEPAHRKALALQQLLGKPLQANEDGAKQRAQHTPEEKDDLERQAMAERLGAAGAVSQPIAQQQPLKSEEVEEATRIAETKRRAEEEKLRLEAEQKRIAEEQRLKAEQEARLKEQEKQQQIEVARQAEEDRKRKLINERAEKKASEDAARPKLLLVQKQAAATPEQPVQVKVDPKLERQKRKEAEQERREKEQAEAAAKKNQGKNNNKKSSNEAAVKEAAAKEAAVKEAAAKEAAVKAAAAKEAAAAVKEAAAAAKVAEAKETPKPKTVVPSRLGANSREIQNALKQTRGRKAGRNYPEANVAAVAPPQAPVAPAPQAAPSGSGNLPPVLQGIIDEVKKAAQPQEVPVVELTHAGVAQPVEQRVIEPQIGSVAPQFVSPHRPHVGPSMQPFLPVHSAAMVPPPRGFLMPPIPPRMGAMPFPPGAFVPPFALPPYHPAMLPPAMFHPAQPGMPIPPAARSAADGQLRTPSESIRTSQRFFDAAAARRAQQERIYAQIHLDQLQQRVAMLDKSNAEMRSEYERQQQLLQDVARTKADQETQTENKFRELQDKLAQMEKQLEAARAEGKREAEAKLAAEPNAQAAEQANAETTAVVKKMLPIASDGGAAVVVAQPAVKASKPAIRLSWADLSEKEEAESASELSGSELQVKPAVRRGP